MKFLKAPDTVRKQIKTKFFIQLMQLRFHNNNKTTCNTPNGTYNHTFVTTIANASYLQLKSLCCYSGSGLTAVFAAICGNYQAH